ncbi:MAG TPA: Crp/Fnr family transcriptional regulator [Candidatus Limnocylindria bacterium]
MSDVEESELFRGLPADEAKEARALAKRRRYAPGDALFHQGDAAEGFMVLLEGRVKVAQTTADGRETLVRFITPGELFGCVPLLGEDRYPGTAEAVEPVTVLAWDSAATARLLEQHPRFATSALRVVGGRLREFQDRLQEVSTERVERRLARALLRLAHQAGRRTEDGVLIDLPITRAELAEMIGTTLYSVSRILAAWQRRGVVSTARQRILVRQPHALVAIGEELGEP